MSAPLRPIAILGLLVLATACSKAVLTPEPGVPGIAAEGAEPFRNAAAARMAIRYLGTPYARAGSSPGGFDCSGLVRHVFARVGVALPHNAAQQFRFGASVEPDGLAPGDVVFFDRLRHNGIYLGDGQFVHATHPGGVKIARLDNEWFRSRWVGARRF